MRAVRLTVFWTALHWGVRSAAVLFAIQPTGTLLNSLELFIARRVPKLVGWDIFVVYVPFPISPLATILAVAVAEVLWNISRSQAARASIVDLSIAILCFLLGFAHSLLVSSRNAGL